VERFAPEGFVDETVYDFNSRRAYINAVYLRGVQMLHDLRDNLGTEVFFGWLRLYADAGAGQLMTPDDLWGLLTPAQFQQTAITRQSYLKTPQITLSATQTSS
jgi:aminopeptidase N